ncbi:MAG: hypothetical protein SWK76_07390 [Actinomycetota bacterium]|nr:hypothetical protein [Actinomycetota bacterium]
MEPDKDIELWNKERESLYEQLQDVDPQLAGLYRWTINLLSVPAEPGEEMARFALIGHCLRELMNSIQDALNDVDGLPANCDREEERERQKLLVDEYEAFGGLPPEDMNANKVEEIGQPKLVTIPQSLLYVVGELVQSVSEGTTREVQRDSAVVLGRIDAHDPAVKPWKAARDYFMSFVHFKRKIPIGLRSRNLPSEREILSHLENIEASLRNRLGAFFDVYDELQDFINQANVLNNEYKYKNPSEGQVRAALARLGNLSLRRAFYSKLNNPYWIAALKKQGVFANPPESKIQTDGYVLSGLWPEIDYLVRMVSIASKEVADILEPIAGSNNEWVRRGIVEAATVLDPADLARLVHKMKKWPDDKIGNFRIDPRDIARAIVRLLESDHHDKGMQLAYAYFCPRPPTKTSKISTEPSAGVEPYWYKECLPSIL